MLDVRAMVGGFSFPERKWRGPQTILGWSGGAGEGLGLEVAEGVDAFLEGVNSAEVLGEGFDFEEGADVWAVVLFGLGFLSGFAFGFGGF